MADMAIKGRHGTKTKPERIVRGESHYWHRHPDRIKRGTDSPYFKLSQHDLQRLFFGDLVGVPVKDAAKELNISRATLSGIRTKVKNGTIKVDPVVSDQRSEDV